MFSTGYMPRPKCVRHTLNVLVISFRIPYLFLHSLDQCMGRSLKVPIENRQWCASSSLNSNSEFGFDNIAVRESRS